MLGLKLLCVAVDAFPLCMDVVEAMVVRMVQFLNKSRAAVGHFSNGNFQKKILVMVFLWPF